MKLYLDDERIPLDTYAYFSNEIYKDDDWSIVRNFNEFKNFIETKGLPEIISFDHDLTDEHYRFAISPNIPYQDFKTESGYHCLVWLMVYCTRKNLPLPEILIHTMNVAGDRNMTNLVAVYNRMSK